MSNIDIIIPIRPCTPASDYTDRISQPKASLAEDDLDGHEAGEVIDQSLVFHSDQGVHGTLASVDHVGERTVIPPITIGDHHVDMGKQVQVRLKEHLVRYTDGGYAMVPPMTVKYETVAPRSGGWSNDDFAWLAGRARWSLTDETHGGWVKPFNGGIIQNPAWLGLNNVYRYGSLCFGSYEQRINQMQGLFMPDTENSPILTIEGARTLTDLFVTSRDNGDLPASGMILEEGSGHILDPGGHAASLHCMYDDMMWELQTNLAIIMAAMLRALDLVDPLDFLDRCHERSHCRLSMDEDCGPDAYPIDSYGVFFLMQEAFLHAHHPDVDRMTPSRELMAALHGFWASFLSMTPYGSDTQLGHPIDLRYECRTQAIGWLSGHPRWEYWQVLDEPPSITLTRAGAPHADLDHPVLAECNPHNVVNGYVSQQYVNAFDESVPGPGGTDVFHGDHEGASDDDFDEDADEERIDDVPDDGPGVGESGDMPDAAVQDAGHGLQHPSRKHGSEPPSADGVPDLQGIIYRYLLDALA